MQIAKQSGLHPAMSCPVPEQSFTETQPQINTKWEIPTVVHLKFSFFITGDISSLLSFLLLLCVWPLHDHINDLVKPSLSLSLGGRSQRSSPPWAPPGAWWSRKDTGRCCCWRTARWRTSKVCVLVCTHTQVCACCLALIDAPCRCGHVRAQRRGGGTRSWSL